MGNPYTVPFPVEHMHGAIVTDFYPNGNLFDTFFDETPIVSADRRLRIARQFVDAVRCLHSAPCRMLHRDLKTSNLVGNHLDPHRYLTPTSA